MNLLETIYRPSLALLTDLYELTMAYGYWKLGRQDQQAVFNVYFRNAPFGGGYAIMAGLEYVTDYLRGVRFDLADREYLASLAGNDGRPLFDEGFLDYLQGLRFTLDIDGIPEGTAVFPLEPLIRVKGSILQGQLLEAPLLNLVNFQTLIATKAARVCEAAKGRPVIEFGLRRAQGVDGALAASRAAFIGGCAGTSNVLAGKLFGLPVRGTHAHSWVMSFPDELAAFEAYAEVQPNNSVFLVDTYNTLEGVKHAAEVGQKLRRQGQQMVGVRMDSGDLAYLSIEARKILDEAGLSAAQIVASNDLDEHLIVSLEDQGAQIDVWGVGTRLVTGHDQPALGGVYKLSAIQDAGRPWEHKVKVSEQAIKTSVPGILQVRRFRGPEGYIGDMIYDELIGPPAEGEQTVIIDPTDATRRKIVPADSAWEDLLTPIMRNGQVVYESPLLPAIRERVREQLANLHPGIRRFHNPHEYPAGLEPRLHELRMRLTLQARGVNPEEAELQK